MTVSAGAKLCSALNIKQLIDKFKPLTHLQEQEKLDVIEAFDVMIKHYLVLKSPLFSLIENQSDAPFIEPPQDELYYLLLTLGAIKNAAGSYLYGNSLFSLIPGISNPLLIVFSFVYVIVNAVLFHELDISFITDALGMTDSSTDLSGVLDMYSKQLKTTLAINKLLLTMPMLLVDDVTWGDYLQLVALINKDIGNKHKHMKLYQESTLTECLNRAVIAFGGLSSVAESYFVANALMATISISLATTPTGWGIMILIVLVDLACYFSMGVTSLTQMMNPDYDDYQSLRKEWAQFDEKSCQNNLAEVQSIKSRFLATQPLSLFSHSSANESSCVHENNPLIKVNTMLGSERN